MSEFNIEDLDAVISESKSSLVQMLALQLKNQLKHGAEQAVQLANAESKCRELAAENVWLKNFIINDCHVAHIEPETFYEEEIIRYVSADGYEPETPATDAFLAEVQASARNDFIGRIEWIIRNECNPDKTEEIINELQNFSEELKSEGAQ
ncbi:hypothetical protein LC177_22030 [Escherichia coli]